ncbi:hypothetical protein R1sor_023554 [Riccia sorocarpa]|uniref:Heparanase-like protein 3 n=1 Tax=Riccia sorocarpa TaxID=122646 RepID=A0ABD3GMZ3_9MARC
MAYLLNRLLLLCTLSTLVCSVVSKTDSVFVKEENTRLVINTSRIVATVDDHFLCATLDWFQPTQCDYGLCNGSLTGVLNLDLENPLFQKTLAGLAPLLVRIGGTLQDLVVYDVGDQLPSEPCLPFVFNESALFSYSGGCLHMDRWDALNKLFVKLGVSVAFGLNALYGRSKSTAQYEVLTPWNPKNAENFIRYTRDRSYPVIAWELGNELLGATTSIGKTVPPELYAADFKKLRNIIDKLYKGDASKPFAVAPDKVEYVIGETDIPRFLHASRKSADVITRHIYNLGSGRNTTDELISKVLDPSVAEAEVAKYKSLQTLLEEHGTTSAWIGEAGGAFGGGHHEVTDAFISAFWYLDQLGTASRYNNQAFCRQSFVGGFYGLVEADFNPNPDYYGALLWRQLMGRGVFDVDVQSGTSDVRAYAHCQRSNKGGLTLLILNYSNLTSHNLDVSLLGRSADPSPRNFTGKNTFSEASASDERLEYHMSAANGSVTGRIVLLNGKPLLVTPSGEIPTLSPVKVKSTNPISLAPLTYAYVVIPDAYAPACATV